MAQAATMGPPLSPRETRRSGRRSAPSASTSTSKSPDSDPAPRQKDIPHRPTLSSNNSSGRNKRPKQEDPDEADDRKNGSIPPNTSTSSAPSATNGRTKRKTKEKDKRTQNSGDLPASSAEDPAPDAGEEEEQGITRCVCGSTGEDDPDAGEFMVQCETCKVWQHGLCMGYESEDQLHDDDYYCELCRPEQHGDLLKKLSKRARHSPINVQSNSASAPSRLSRSHSPSHASKQPSKRRNTMNSRDAAFDESLKEIIEATAAEAAAAHDSTSVTSNGNAAGPFNAEEDAETESSSRKKRKRTEDDAVPKKRTRSASSASDHPMGSIVARDDTPVCSTQGKVPSQPSAPPLKTTGRNRRGGRKTAAPDTQVSMEAEDGTISTTITKRQANSSRAKPSNAPKRPPATIAATHGPSSTSHEHGTRRNQVGGVNGQISGSTAEASRAYRNSHAYVVSQQPLFTSWNLPDYLAHLEEMLPTNTPRPLEVRAGSSMGGVTGTGGLHRGEAIDTTMERGVKVKWPSKRMSVGDMNKRVRALVEWVGREQASALDRGRRRDALEKALHDETQCAHEHLDNIQHSREPGENDRTGQGVVPMILDSVASESPVQEKPQVQVMCQDREHSSIMQMHDMNEIKTSATMKMMEELMEELIVFQERFGPGAKSRERERRMAAAIAAS